MDIPIDATVQCEGELAGRSRMVIVDPVKRQVTHFVMKEKDHPDVERLVPLELVHASTPQLIQLGCTRQELAQQKRFVDAEYIRPNLPFLTYSTGDFAVWPYFPPAAAAPVSPEHYHVPPGEVAVSRGTRVEAVDGHVGRVDEFLVNPQTAQITHLVLREGHLWGQKDVTIPVAEIDHITDDVVFLKLYKQGIEALPTVSVDHWLF